MTQRLSALFAGSITAIVVLMMFKFNSVGMHPPGEGVDLNDPLQRQAYQDSLPPLAWIMVSAGMILGTFFGGVGASYLAKTEIPRMCATIGAGMLVLTVFNVVQDKPPTWFAVLTVVGVLAAIPVAIRFGMRWDEGEG